MATTPHIRPPPPSTLFPYTTLFRSSILDPGDTLIGSRPVGVMSSGSYSAGSTLVTIPADATPGARYLIVLADGGQDRPSTRVNYSQAATSFAVCWVQKMAGLSAAAR